MDSKDLLIAFLELFEQFERYSLAVALPRNQALVLSPQNERAVCQRCQTQLGQWNSEEDRVFLPV